MAKVPKERLDAEAHCIERAWERYRIRLTHEQIRALGERIAGGEGIGFGVPQPRMRIARGRGVLITLDDGTAMPFLYVPGIGCVTVLPRDAKQVIKAVMVAAMAAMRGKNGETV